MDTFTDELVPGSEHLKCLFYSLLLGEVFVRMTVFIVTIKSPKPFCMTSYQIDTFLCSTQRAEQGHLSQRQCYAHHPGCYAPSRGSGERTSEAPGERDNSEC